MSNPAFKFDHVHIISENPRASAQWYVETFGATIAAFAATLPTDPDHRRRLAYYRRGYHLLLRDLDGAAVAGDVASWVIDRRAALPSQSDVIENARSWPPEPDRVGPTPVQAEPPAPPGLASSSARR